MTIKSECYALLQAVVVARDILCRAPTCDRYASASHHIFPRANLSTAFDPHYAIGLCVNCHVPWAHAKPDQFRQWVISWMGEDEYYFGLRKSHSIVKDVNYAEIREGLKRILAAYKKA